MSSSAHTVGALRPLPHCPPRLLSSWISKSLFLHPLKPHVRFVELQAARVGHSRGLDRHHHIITGFGDRAGPGIFQLIGKLEFDDAFSTYIATGVDFRRRALTIAADAAEEDRHGLAALFQA